MQLIEQKLKAVKQSPESLVDVIQKKMLKYIESNNITTELFLIEAFQVTKKAPPDYLQAEFDSFGGLPIFIQFYCDKDNVHFGVAKFIVVCETMRIAVREARILHIHMGHIKEVAILSYPDICSSSVASSDLSMVD
mmetsp:Transcript_22105/g.31758  ORF Transcript_22105/g.31758 Transcript_22105/m.31758 type:complete len:136 (-) Transcript_22105:78-485(-)